MNVRTSGLNSSSGSVDLHVLSHITVPGPSQAPLFAQAFDPALAYGSDQPGGTAPQHNPGKSHFTGLTCVDQQEAQFANLFLSGQQTMKMKATSTPP